MAIESLKNLFAELNICPRLLSELNPRPNGYTRNELAKLDTVLNISRCLEPVGKRQ